MKILVLLFFSLVAFSSNTVFANDCTYKFDSDSVSLIRWGARGAGLSEAEGIEAAKEILGSRGWTFTEDSTNTLVDEERITLKQHRGWYGYITGYMFDNSRTEILLKLAIKDFSSKITTTSSGGIYNYYSVEHRGTGGSGDNTVRGVFSALKKSLKTLTVCE